MIMIHEASVQTRSRDGRHMCITVTVSFRKGECESMGSVPLVPVLIYLFIYGWQNRSSNGFVLINFCHKMS